MKKINNYEGWELKYFDNSKNFREYQYQLIKEYIKKITAEVGPGNGASIKDYIHKCEQLNLFEPDRNLYLNLKKNYFNNKKVKIYNKLLNVSKKKYQTILYLDVLEHIENDKAEILKAYNLLEKKGYLVINVPAFQILYSIFDKDIGHFKRYRKKDFYKIAKKFKIQIVKIKYYDSIGFLLSLVSKIFLNNYKKNFKQKIKIWNFLILLSKILDKIIFHSFGKSLLVVIEKK